VKYPDATPNGGAFLAFTVVDAIVIILAAFVPSFIYLVWIRNTERFAPEPYGRLLRVFAYGAGVSIVIAIVGELIAMNLFNANIQRFYDILGENPNLTSLALAIIIAPLIEELTKSIGVFRLRRFMSDIEDGMIYGAAAGLGFAATENLLYEGSAFLTGGPEAFIQTAVIRSLSSALLHASASAVVGLGIAHSFREGKSWLPYYFGGVLMHGSFNLFASLGDIYSNQTEAALIGLTAAFIIAIGGISIVRSKIRALDIQSARSRRR
jgi:RsiW-degrading membrane proteinase PrsW (M82 family)